MIYKRYIGISNGYAEVPVPDLDREYMPLQVDVKNGLGYWVPTKSYSFSEGFIDLNASIDCTEMRVCWLDITASES